MRYFATLLFCMLAAVSSPVDAADPKDVFSTILGEIGRQIEQDRQRKSSNACGPCGRRVPRAMSRLVTVVRALRS